MCFFKKEKLVVKISLKKIKKKKNKEYCFNNIKKHLQKNNACYVLITCTDPSIDGKMQVELNYSGDENLAAYLVDGARSMFDSGINKVKDGF